MRNYTIRKAQVTDSRRLGRIHRQCWQETYEQILDAEYLAALDVRIWEKRWQQHLASENLTAFVLENEQGQIVGFTSLDMRFYQGEEKLFVKSLYLLKDYQKRGWGGALFQAALNCARDKGAEEVFIEVLKDNPTLAFYQKYTALIVEEKTISSVKNNYQNLYCG